MFFTVNFTATVFFLFFFYRKFNSICPFIQLFQSIFLLPNILDVTSSRKCGLVTVCDAEVCVCVEDPLPNPWGPYRELALSFFQIPSAPFLWALLTMLQLHMTHLITSHSVVLGRLSWICVYSWGQTWPADGYSICPERMEAFYHSFRGR